MISDKTRAALIERLKTNGTLASGVPAHTITAEAAAQRNVKRIADMVRAQRTSRSTSRWLAPQSHLTVLP